MSPPSLPSVYKPRRQDFFPGTASSNASALGHIKGTAGRWARSLRKTALQPTNTRRRRAALGALGAALQPRRIVSVPNLLLLVWVLLLLWGERWVFSSRVRGCDWDNWEDWPSDATPHRLVLVADPQLIDPHTYPGRPWPLSSLTYTVTDNYMRRSYSNLERHLAPDSVFFIGDMFDGGREWRTDDDNDDWTDQPWGRKRPADEQKQLSTWRKNNRQQFWLGEYARLVEIFGPHRWATTVGRGLQRGRKMVWSLPGNHDHGFGTQVRMAALNRFATYFGEPNRVDVVGNHTFVSVDTPSLAARHAEPAVAELKEVQAIHKPVTEFLDEVPEMKRRAVERELRFWHGDDAVPGSASTKYEHVVYSANDVPAPMPQPPDAPQPEFPTILLTHVPLYRAPGTPCGPSREHWPPARPAPGATGPVRPDHRNAISVSGGYQYQNVLEEEDSQMLVRSIGNVVHVFSGDDHDYCELVHDGGGDKAGIREITVKSISMAMGVPTPGVLMVSLWNPVGPDGKSLFPGGGKGAPTLQTHLCLLPNQLSMYGRYAGFGIFTIIILALRAIFVSTLGTSGDAEEHSNNTAPQRSPLPLYNDDKRDSYFSQSPQNHSTASYSGRHSGTGSASRTRSGSLLAANAPANYPPPLLVPSRSHAKGGGGGGGHATTPPAKQLRINIHDDFYDGAKPRKLWRASGGGLGGGGGVRSGLRGVLRETRTTVWRVFWVAVLFWAYLTWRG